MEKDFDNWNIHKKEIDTKNSSIRFHQREIWWCVLGLNIGREQNGRGDNFERPVVVIKKLSKDTMLCVPLSTKKRLDEFQSKITSSNIEGYALIDQLRVVDTKRLIRKIALADIEEFEMLVLKIKQLL